MKIGLFSIGLDTYWGQYEGLLPRLQGYESEIATHIGEMGVEVVRGGMVDNEAKSLAAASLFSREEVELVCIFISTYALSSTVLPLVQRVGKPVLLLNIQPEAAIDYARLNAMGDRVRMTGEWLAHCQACSVPEILNTAPTDDTSNGKLVKTVVPKLSRTAHGRSDASRFFFSSSLTVNVAVSPQR